ncbi:MAG: diguanylate cyclase [Nitrospirota bacterium]
MAGTKRILIVWHDEGQAISIGDRLMREGLEPELAGSYAEALMLLSAKEYDAVLTEHYPPRIDSAKLLGYGRNSGRDIPLIVVVPMDVEEIASFFKKGAFDVVRKDSAMSFLDKLPFSIRKAIEEEQLKEQTRTAEARLTRERLISEATLQSVINGVVFINSQGTIEKINRTLEALLGKELVKLGANVCELPEDHLIRRLFMKPLESGACWEVKECARRECPAFGRKDCLCWFIKEACSICSGPVATADRYRLLLQCAFYKKAQERYYTAPVELDYGGRFLNVYRRNVLDEQGALIGEIFDFVDMTSEKDFREQLRVLSITDALTGLHNRRYITQRVVEEFHESRRYLHDMSLMIVDIDDFKHINDTYGHPVGDEVLRQVAAVLERERRKSDVVGRYGGEEFVIIMPQTNEQEAAVMAERLRKKIEDHFFIVNTERISFTISIGVSALSETMEDIDDLLKAADKALYTAKARGKNRIVVL